MTAVQEGSVADSKPVHVSAVNNSGGNPALMEHTPGGGTAGRNVTSAKGAPMPIIMSTGEVAGKKEQEVNSGTKNAATMRPKSKSMESDERPHEMEDLDDSLRFDEPEAKRRYQ